MKRGGPRSELEIGEVILSSMSGIADMFGCVRGGCEILGSLGPEEGSEDGFVKRAGE